jgi:two-component system, OmpR family, response regulator BaeR
MADVLLVDDEPLLRSVVAEYLRFAGHTVAECRDGDEALEHLRTSPTDIVVSDVLMPGMDGLALCGAMRATPDLVNIPVLFVTARNVEPDMQAEMDRIGDGSVFKPFEPKALLEAIERAIRRHAAT